jgi:hypothetical protein
MSQPKTNPPEPGALLRNRDGFIRTRDDFLCRQEQRLWRRAIMRWASVNLRGKFAFKTFHNRPEEPHERG